MVAEAVRYGTWQRRLHWLVVVLVAAQLILHDGMAQTWEAAIASGDWAITPGAAIHFGIGSAILLAMGLRWMLRMEVPVPAPTGPVPQLARAVHLGFYAVLVLLPITGGLAWGTQSPGLGLAHEVLRALLVLLILAHIGGAAVHRFVWRDGPLSRMWPPV